MKKKSPSKRKAKRSEDDLRQEYQFDYSKAQPNRFVERIRQKSPKRAATGLGTEIAELFANVGLTFDIPELRGHKIKPPSFEE